MLDKPFAGGLRQLICLMIVMALCVGARAQTLFYSGDTNGGGNANFVNSGFGNRTFDDFTVGSGLGWNINTVFSNDIQALPAPNHAVQAEWSIRSGMGPGNPGTILFSGTTTATQTPTLRSVPGFIEDMITVDVSGLGIHLAPGTYFLQVSPVSNVGEEAWFNSTTNGANGVNALNNHAGLFSSGSATTPPQPTGVDYSLGITGTVGPSAVTPEGSSLAMLLLGGLPLVIGFGRKFRSKRA
jgi:hypothetical protein